MKIKITAIVISLLLFKVVVVSAQSSNDKYAFLLKAGNKEFDALRYKYAIPYYRAYLKKNTTSNETLQLIGDCYYKMISYDSALQIYTSLAEKNINVLEKIAELYAWKKDYTAAKKTYHQLISQNKSAARKKYYDERLSGFEKLSFFYKDSLDWKTQYLSINTAAQEFSPFMFQQGLLFVSNRKIGKLLPNTYGWDGSGFEAVYWVKDRSSLFEINSNSIQKEAESNLDFSIDKTPATSNDNNTLAQRVMVSKPGPSANSVPLFESLLQYKGHSGPISISEEGNTIYFTRNRSEKTKGVHLLEICKVEKTSTGWGKVKTLSLNVTTASSYHPFVNASGTVLYFASDREGGFGGADIYKVEKLNDSTWSVPENMGPRVNTQGNEVFPSINKNKLFFSSNGWGGLGGLDIFETAELPTKNPSNLGYPVNSSSDDFGYVSTADGKEGYFSSNRFGSDDLFGYRYEKYYRELIGTIMGGETKKIQPGVKIKLYWLDDNGNKSLADSTESDEIGRYKFNIRPNQKYVLGIDGNAEIKAATSNELVTNNHPINNGIWEVYANKVNVKKTITSTVPTENNHLGTLKNDSKFSFTIYHPFAKAAYREADEKIVKEVIQLLKDHVNYRLQIVSATDCKGSQEYNLALSERRARFVLNQLPKQLQAKAIMRWVSENEPNAPCEQGNTYDETAQGINRYTYLLVSDASK